MPISQGDLLFLLVKSLTTSEKRSFTSYASRLQDLDDIMYMQLFEYLDKQKEFDEAALLKKLKISDKSKFSNLKRHLYKQILTSLKLVHIRKKDEVQIREYLDFSDILYDKGLYLQSLKILDKAKHLAKKINSELLYLSIIENEKTIQSRHITRSGHELTTTLVNETNVNINTLTNITRLSNLRILLHGYYISNGHARSEAEELRIKEYFDKQIANIKNEGFSYLEQIYLNQSYVWYYYILQDFHFCIEHAKKWVDIFKSEPEMIKQDPDLYMRGYHYLMTCAQHLQEVEIFSHALNELQEFRAKNYKKFSYNSRIISFLYAHYGVLNLHFLNNTYQEGLKALPRTLNRISMFKSKMDLHHIMVFYFKIAWMNLMADHPAEAVDYLNKIQNMEIGALRKDIQGYTRLMFIMAHYDLENFELLHYLVNAAKQFYKSMKDVNKLQKSILEFFEKIERIPIYERKAAFKSFKEKLCILANDKYEKRAFLYLDIAKWVDRKL